MVYSNQLQRNTGIIDPLIFSQHITDSYFWHHGYSTVKNNFIVRKDVDPQAGASFGGHQNFKIPQIADKWGPTQLIFTLSAIPDNGDANRRYQDFVGLIAWETIELLYSTGELYTLCPEDAFLKYRQLHNVETRDAMGELIAGDKSQAQRVTLAQSAQTLIVDLPFPHCRGTSRWMEIMQLAQEPRVRIKWRTIDDIVQTTGPSPAITITNVKLRCAYVHQDGDERDSNTARTESTDGIIRLFDDFKTQTNRIAAGVTTQAIKLNNFRTSSKRIGFIVRLQSDLDTARAKNYFGNLQPIASFSLEAADGKIIETVEDRYYRYYLHSQWHGAPAGDFIYEWSFALAPDDYLNASGSYNFGNTTNATLTITFPAPLAAGVEVTTVVHEYNTHQHVRGDLLKNFK